MYRWIKEASERLPKYQIEDNITEIEFDEMWHFIKSKKNKLWVIKALDKRTGRTIAWELGNRNTKTFKKLYDKVKHLQKFFLQKGM